MTTRWGIAALGLAATLGLSACGKPAEQASTNPYPGKAVARLATAEPPGPLHLYNAEPHDRWVLAGNVGASEIYIAPPSFQLRGNHRVAIGEKVTTNPIAADGEAYTIYKIEIDCARGTQKALGYVRYNAADLVIGHAEFGPANQKESTAGEGTVGYAVAQPLCKALDQG